MKNKLKTFYEDAQRFKSIEDSIEPELYFEYKDALESSCYHLFGELCDTVNIMGIKKEDIVKKLPSVSDRVRILCVILCSLYYMDRRGVTKFTDARCIQSTLFAKRVVPILQDRVKKEPSWLMDERTYTIVNKVIGVMHPTLLQTLVRLLVLSIEGDFTNVHMPEYIKDMKGIAVEIVRVENIHFDYI